MDESETLTKLLNPGDQVITFATRMHEKMLRHSKNESERKDSMRIAYRYMLETTAHDMGLTFTQDPTLEHGYEA